MVLDFLRVLGRRPVPIVTEVPSVIMSDQYTALVRIAEYWLHRHVVEKGGDNHGAEVETFQDATGNRPGDPWCMSFCQQNIQIVSAIFAMLPMVPSSGGVLEVWVGTKTDQKLMKPFPGAIVCFQTWKDGQATSSGHAGIVTRIIDDKTFETIEGNTNADGSRDGDGVYRKIRPLAGYSNFKILGYLKAFA